MASGRALDYDYVIYAVGSTAAIPSSVPGAAEFAFDIAEFESAQRLRARLEELPPDAPVTVVGGGLTGIETAAELAERGRRVTLACGRTLAPSLSAPGRRSVATWLSRHGVAVLEAAVVSEVRPEGGRLRRRWGACERTDHLDGRFRRAGVGGRERAAHRRARPAAHRRDADQRRRRPHRRGRGRRRTVGPTAADELPGRTAARGAGRQHGAEPHRGNRTGGDRPGPPDRASASAGAPAYDSSPAKTTRR
ncbi:FAD-dependent oxidoreductase [Streptosporangium canum]|uniref:FAD-dependent oxidoreductase n=1 Tax=Streptosporangium canum TaxID=324952 RepID=UPI00378F4F02